MICNYQCRWWAWHGSAAACNKLFLCEAKVEFLSILDNWYNIFQHIQSSSLQIRFISFKTIQTIKNCPTFACWANLISQPICNTHSSINMKTLITVDSILGNHLCDLKMIIQTKSCSSKNVRNLKENTYLKISNFCCVLPKSVHWFVSCPGAPQ